MTPLTRLQKLTRPNERMPECKFCGEAFDAGRYVAAWSLEHYPFYPRYLSMACQTWRSPAPHLQQLFQQRAPWILRFYQGMLTALEQRNFDENAPMPPIPVRTAECTSFSLPASLCANQHPLSGQTKDTSIDSLDLYMVLNLTLTDGPSLLTLAYPGELLGYGFRAGGLSIFRNDMRSTQKSPSGLDFTLYGLLARECSSVDEAVCLAQDEGIAGCGHLLLTDGKDSISLEFNAGGLGILRRDKDTPLVHANHGEAPNILPYIDTTLPRYTASCHRAQMLRERFAEAKPPYDIAFLNQALASHSCAQDDWGVCRHGDDSQSESIGTSAAVVAEPLAGRLYVTKGPACMSQFSAFALPIAVSEK